MKVTKITPLTGAGVRRVYDFTVADTHNYELGAGVVVSNSKRISLLDVNALLSHGATETLRDASAVRGQKNEEYWLQFMQGHKPRDPEVPMVYKKFVSQLKAAGANVVRDGNRVNVMAMTNSDVNKLAGDRIIKSGETVRFDKDLQPISGGLFDPKLTGGHNGNQWAAIELPEPMLNPLMEEPARRLLGLTQKQLDGVISGEHKLGSFGTGPKALQQALAKIDVDRELIIARAQMKGTSAAKRDAAVRKLGYLKTLQKTGMSPKDWVLDKVPVLPPVFRPVSVMGSEELPMVSDVNYLYKELLDANNNLIEAKKHLGEEGVGAERVAVQNAFRAVTGLGEPVHPKLKEKNVKGILAGIFSNSPKYGTVQRKLIASTVDNVGRGVVVPNPDMDMDAIGLPEEKAFDVYGRFVARRLKQQGMPLSQAIQEVRDKTARARDMLEKEMERRPVIMNRAPVLHKFGIMAFRPKLMTGSAIHTSPLIVKGFGMDFDGDAVQFHVPTTDEAIDEAYERMLPSKNLLSPADMKSPAHVPGQEYLAGLYSASTGKRGKQRPRVFRNVNDLKAAFARGDVRADDPIELLEDA